MKKIIFYPLFAVVVSFLLLTACSKGDDVEALGNSDLARRTASEFILQNEYYEPERIHPADGESIKWGNFEVNLLGQEKTEKMYCFAVDYRAWRGASCDFWMIFVSRDGKTVLGYLNQFDPC